MAHEADSYLMLEPSLVQHVKGFGQPSGADAYVFAPETPEQIHELYQLARRTGRSVSFAGSRRSYGSPMVTPEGIIISLENCNTLGPIEDDAILVGGGVTLEQLWRAVAPQGYWPKVVSGTAKVTVAGAIAANIHGKNAFKVGHFGDSVSDIELISPARGHDPGEAVGSMGLFGAIASARVHLQKIESSSLWVSAASSASWSEHLALFEENENGSDYMVGWVDMYNRRGRGLFHSASYAKEGKPLLAGQLRESPLFGLIPRAEAWRVLKFLNRPSLTRILNAGKYFSAKVVSGKNAHCQSLAEFNFLLDALPGWERAYPNGLLQFQAFLPRSSAESTFKELQSLQHKLGMVSSLAVLKRHRESRQVLPYALDGYSLAMDFARQVGLRKLCDEMTEVVIEAGGRFYMAKDSALTADQYRRSQAPESLEEYRRLKAAHDPENLLQSIQSRHLGLT